jgi:hypothetical protein
MFIWFLISSINAFVRREVLAFFEVGFLLCSCFSDVSMENFANDLIV